MSFTVLKTENMNIHKIWTNRLNAFVDLSKWTNELADPKKQDNSQASIDEEQVNLKVYSRVDLSDYLLLTNSSSQNYISKKISTLKKMMITKANQEIKLIWGIQKN